MGTKNKFDSHAILVKFYTCRIEAWDWATIIGEAEASRQCQELGEREGWSGIGYGDDLYPSCKNQMPRISKQRLNDIRRDNAFFDALEAVAERHNGYMVWEGGYAFFVLPRLDESMTPLG